MQAIDTPWFAGDIRNKSTLVEYPFTVLVISVAGKIIYKSTCHPFSHSMDPDSPEGCVQLIVGCFVDNAEAQDFIDSVRDQKNKKTLQCPLLDLIEHIAEARQKTTIREPTDLLIKQMFDRINLVQ
jgi:hypothetical protein